MSDRPEVIILGGGVAGFSTAYHLGKKGVSCQVIEMDSIGAKASGRAEGLISPPSFLSIFDTSWTPRGCLIPSLDLAREGCSRYPKLAQELREEGGVDVQYVNCDFLLVAFDENMAKLLKKVSSEEMKRDGEEIIWLGADAVKAKTVGIGLGPEPWAGVLLHAGQLDAYRYTLALAQAAEALGTTIKYREAVGFRHKGNRVNSVILPTGEIGAEAVVIAMGPWSKQAVSWLGVEIPMKSVRAQALKLEYAQPFPISLVAFQFGTEGNVCRKVDGSVMVGYIEEVGVEPDDEQPTKEGREELITLGTQIVPELSEAVLVEHRSGVLSYLPDCNPILGRVPGWDNVYIATGLGTNGIIFSPAVGRIMADLIVTGRTDKAIERLGMDRFGH